MKKNQKTIEPRKDKNIIRDFLCAQQRIPVGLSLSSRTGKEVKSSPQVFLLAL